MLSLTPERISTGCDKTDTKVITVANQDTRGSKDSNLNRSQLLEGRKGAIDQLPIGPGVRLASVWLSGSTSFLDQSQSVVKQEKNKEILDYLRQLTKTQHNDPVRIRNQGLTI